MSRLVRLAAMLAIGCGLALSTLPREAAERDEIEAQDAVHGPIEAWVRKGNEAINDGRLDEALAAYGAAEALLAELDPKTVLPEVEADVAYGFSSLYQRLGRLPEARHSIRRAQALDARAGAGPATHAGTSLLLARVERLDGRFDQSRQAIERGFQLLDQEDDVTIRASLHQERALHLLAEGLLDEATWELESVLGLVSGKALGHIVNDLAAIALQRGEFDGAIRFARDAVRLSRSACETRQDEHLPAHARFILSQALARIGDLDAARANVDQALDRVDAARLQDDDDFGLGYTAMRRDYVRHRLDLATDARDAFQVIDRYRARGLLAGLVHSSGHRSQARRAAAVALLDALDARDAWRSSTGPQRRELLDAAVLRRRSQLWASAVDPAGRLASAGKNPVDLLAPDALALLFAEGMDGVHVVTLDASGRLTHQPLPIEREALGQEITQLVAALADGREGSSRRMKLGRRLLGPIARHLAKVERLVILSDGIFAELPFAALGHPQTGQPLIRTHATTYVSSFSILAANRWRRSTCAPPEKGSVVFGHPLLSSRDPRWPEGVDDRRSSDEIALWDLLPAAEAEAFDVATLYRRHGPGLLALGRDATAVRFLDALEHHALIHIAGHAEANPQIPERSRILMSCVGPGGRPVERCDVYLPAIAERRLCGPTVVLSACATAVGPRVEGEGILGLPRTLLRAGAARVVASRWRVADEPTRELMIDFHTRLLAGRSAAEALRQAGLAALDRGHGPSVWSAFSVFGDDDPNLFPAPGSLDTKASDRRRPSDDLPEGDDR